MTAVAGSSNKVGSKKTMAIFCLLLSTMVYKLGHGMMGATGPENAVMQHLDPFDYHVHASPSKVGIPAGAVDLVGDRLKRQAAGLVKVESTGGN